MRLSNCPHPPGLVFLLLLLQLLLLVVEFDRTRSTVCALYSDASARLVQLLTEDIVVVVIIIAYLGLLSAQRNVKCFSSNGRRRLMPTSPLVPFLLCSRVISDG